MINWKNTAENLGLVLAGVVFGSILGYQISIKTQQNTLKQLIPTIEQAIDKETIKNEIKNDIKVEIDKIKKSDSLNINVNQKPVNNQKPTNVITPKPEPKKEKRGFFKRLFGKK